MKNSWLILVLALWSVTTTQAQPLEVREIAISEPAVHYRSDHRPIKDLDLERGIIPQVYALAATRATNKMVDQTRDLPEDSDKNFLYIMETKVLDKDLPAGFSAAEKITREILESSENFKVTNQKTEADYILKIIIGNGGSEQRPIVVYKLILLDKDEVKLREWTESVRRVRNDDRSWW